MHFKLTVLFKSSRRSQESQKEMSVLLNMYKVIPKDQRDKAALLQCEAKLRSELTVARVELERLHSTLLDVQQQNTRLQQQLQHQQPKRSSLASPMTGAIKASPVERTPPLTLSSAVVSPLTFQKASPDDRNQQTSQTGSTTLAGSSKLAQPGYNCRITELQLELQMTRRRKQSLDAQLEKIQNRLLAAEQKEEVLLKDLEVRQLVSRFTYFESEFHVLTLEVSVYFLRNLTFTACDSNFSFVII